MKGLIISLALLFVISGLAEAHPEHNRRSNNQLHHLIPIIEHLINHDRRDEGPHYWRGPSWRQDYRYSHLDCFRRRHHVFSGFYLLYSRPMIVHNDHYSDEFFWWLSTISPVYRDLWYYNHWYGLDQNRVRLLLEDDPDLQDRLTIIELENHGRRDLDYVPPGVEPDLQYKDEYLRGDE